MEKMRKLWNKRNPNHNKKIEEDSEDECYLLPEVCKEDMLKHGKIVENPTKNMENPKKILENPTQNPFVVAFNKGIQNQAGNGIQNLAGNGIQNLTGNGIQKQTGNGNYTYNPRGNLGSLAENQIQQSDQFEINTDIELVENRRVRFNPNVKGQLIAFENVNEK